jgi:hypothetical protein
MAAGSGRARVPKKRGGSGWTQLPLEGVPPSTRTAAPPSNGEWLEVLVADLAIEFGDVENTPSHREQVKALWRRSGLPESDFARVLVEVRARAKSWRGKIGRAGSEAQPHLKMKAFFLLLKDRVGVVEGSDAALSTVNRFKKVGSETAAPRSPGTAGGRPRDAPRA